MASENVVRQQLLDLHTVLGGQLADAVWRADSAAIPRQEAEGGLVVAGMGGSAIGGDLAAALLADELKIPMSIHRDYGIPGYVGRDSLVIASSYSGNTEESLSAFGEAQKRGAKVLVLTTGGKLAELGRGANYPVVTFSYKAQPRAALGYSLGLVLGCLVRLGFVRDLSADIDPPNRNRVIEIFANRRYSTRPSGVCSLDLDGWGYRWLRLA